MKKPKSSGILLPILIAVLVTVVIILSTFIPTILSFRGSGRYEWISINDTLGIRRTDTGQYILLPDIDADVTLNTDITQTNPASGIEVKFQDLTTLPGMVSLTYKNQTIDIMKSRISVDNHDLSWQD